MTSSIKLDISALPVSSEGSDSLMLLIDTCVSDKVLNNLKERVCKNCKQKKLQQYFRDNRSKCKTCSRSKETAESKRNNHLKRKYDMTLEEFEQKFISQGGKCKICKEESKKRLHVDHNHVTGQVRGLLFSNCNTGLGLFQDSFEVLEHAVLYLKEYNNKPPIINAFTLMMDAARKLNIPPPL